jgi:hypothetical protein
MIVRQVIDRTREWVFENGARTPGFLGAHLKGSILGLPGDSPFPPYRDVDVNLVVDGRPHGVEFREISSRELILDCAIYSADFYSSAEVVLANAALAPNLTGGGLLADPEGQLARLQAKVAEEYDRRPWVQARCGERKQVVRQGLARLAEASEPAEAGRHLWFVAKEMAAIVAIAHLKPPTHRRGLVRLRKLLLRSDREDLHHKVLTLLGFAQLSKEQVVRHLERCMEIFDRAAELQPAQAHTRPYVFDGSLEMIEAGDHREAMHWIAAQTIRAMTVIEAHGSPIDRSRFEPQVVSLLGEMGLLGPGRTMERHRQAQVTADEVIKLADDVIATSPAVRD